MTPQTGEWLVIALIVLGGLVVGYEMYQQIRRAQ